MIINSKMKNTFWSKVANVAFGDDYFPTNFFTFVFAVLAVCGGIALYVGRTYESEVIKTEYVRAHVKAMDPPKHVYAICTDESNGITFEVSLGKWCSGWDTIPLGSSFTVKRELHHYTHRADPDFYVYDAEAQIKSFIKQ